MDKEKIERNTVFIEVSINDLNKIEKLPGFIPIYLYPKLSEVHMRCWGFIVLGEIEYFFRADLNHEKIEKMTTVIQEIMLRFGGIIHFVNIGVKDFNELSLVCKKCIEGCQYLINMYKDK